MKRIREIISHLLLVGLSLLWVLENLGCSTKNQTWGLVLPWPSGGNENVPKFLAQEEHAQLGPPLGNFKSLGKREQVEGPLGGCWSSCVLVCTWTVLSACLHFWWIPPPLGIGVPPPFYNGRGRGMRYSTTYLLLKMGVGAPWTEGRKDKYR